MSPGNPLWILRTGPCTERYLRCPSQLVHDLTLQPTSASDLASTSCFTRKGKGIQEVMTPSSLLYKMPTSLCSLLFLLWVTRTGFLFFYLRIAPLHKFWFHSQPGSLGVLYSKLLSFRNPCLFHKTNQRINKQKTKTNFFLSIPKLLQIYVYLYLPETSPKVVWLST